MTGQSQSPVTSLRSDEMASTRAVTTMQMRRNERAAEIVERLRSRVGEFTIADIITSDSEYQFAQVTIRSQVRHGNILKHKGTKHGFYEWIGHRSET